MSVALYVSLENPLADFDASAVCGKALEKAQDHLDRIAERLGLTPLQQFISVGGEEFERVFGDDARSEEAPIPDYEWFDAREGLKTIAGLLEFLSENPSVVRNVKRVMEDLEAAEKLLTTAAERGIRFHLSIDF